MLGDLSEPVNEPSGRGGDGIDHWLEEGPCAEPAPCLEDPPCEGPTYAGGRLEPDG